MTGEEDRKCAESGTQPAMTNRNKTVVMYDRIHRTAKTTASEQEQQKVVHRKRMTGAMRRRLAKGLEIIPGASSVTCEEVKGEEINQGTLGKRLCTQCGIPGRLGKFRPLVGDVGNFVCDLCYRSLFPATAMVDDGVNSGVLDLAQRSATAVNRGIGRAVAGAASKMGVEGWKECTEEEECRTCLDPGALRPCCRNYYCHECYFHGKSCPGCGSEVHLTGISRGRRGSKRSDLEDPGRFAVGLTWLISFLTAISALLIGSAVVWNDHTSPITVWGHKCHGWFPSCDINVCIDAEGSSSEELGMPWQYRRCSLSNTSAKVVGKACTYDGQLYDRTGGAMGYDFCLDAPREVHVGMGGGDGVSFQQGSYVFEDDFDHWVPTYNNVVNNNNSNTSTQGESDGLDPSGRYNIGMRSATWTEMTNGEVSDKCGVNSTIRNPLRGFTYSDEEEGNLADATSGGALVFSGVHYRYATTSVLDLIHGGHVEFHLKFAPITPNERSAVCKTAYGGDLALSYSTHDNGNASNDDQTWIDFGLFPVYKYRNPYFTAVTESIPRGAQTNATWLRWSQPTFDPLRDWWAIDNVRVFRNFEQGWRNSTGYEGDKRQRMEQVQREQCCADTEKCKRFPNDNPNADKDKWQCVASSTGFLDMASRDKFRLKSYELFIVGAAFVSLGRWAYDALSLKLSSAGSTHNNGSIVPDKLYDKRRESSFPRQNFAHEVQRSWQVFNVVLLIAPLALIAWRLVATCISAGTFGGAGLLSLFLSTLSFFVDGRVIYRLLKEVFFVGPLTVLLCPPVAPVAVEVDTDPDFSYILIGSQRIHLNDVTDMEIFSSFYCYILYLCYILGGFPFASACVVLRTFPATFGWSSDSVRVCTRIVGTLVIARAFTGGPDIFVRMFLGLEWLFCFSVKSRDDIGRALKRRGLTETIWYSTAIAFLFGGFLVVSSGDGIKRGKWIMIFGHIFLGALLGCLMGMMRDLPVNPHIHLTRWPSRGHSVIYHHRVRCPCLFNFAYCGDMNSHRRLLIIFLDDMMGYCSLLRGEAKDKTPAVLNGNNIIEKEEAPNLDSLYEG